MLFDPVAVVANIAIAQAAYFEVEPIMRRKLRVDPRDFTSVDIGQVVGG